MTPYILQLATEQSSGRQTHDPLAYDARRQVSVLVADPDGPAAVLHPDVGVLLTKKEDREKGEDQKDRWMPDL
jgi:hypothetical protein